jgi:hypothetical protein
MKGLLKAVGFGLFLVLIGTAWGEVGVWSAGDWEALHFHKSGIDFESTPGAIQPREFRPGENVALGFEWKKGRPVDYAVTGRSAVWVPLAAFENVDFRFLVDGDSSSSTEDRFKMPGVNYYGYPFYFDFGESLLISGISFYPRQEGKDEEGYYNRDFFMKGFTIRVNDGFSFTSDGNPVWTELKSTSNNRESIVDIGFSPRRIRFVKLTNTAKDMFELAEVEFYGAGFSRESNYTSNVIDLEEKSNIGKVFWETSKWRRLGDELIEAPDAEVSIKAEGRSGLDPTPEIYFSTKDDTVKEVTREEYLELSRTDRSVKEDREHWSPWFSLGSGEVFPTFGPRRYTQFRTYLSGTLTEMCRVEDFRLEYAVPLLAEEIIGEVALTEEPSPPGGIAEVVPGEKKSFTYDVKARFVSVSQKGFDCLKIETPSKPEFLWFVAGGDTIEPAYVSEEPNYLEVLFPPSHRITIHNNRALRVLFKTAILSYGTELRGYALDTQAEELPQVIEPGDAHPDVGTNSMSVYFFKKAFGNMLPAFEVSPVITPNGDGSNDEALIFYVIAQMDPVFGRAEVGLGIYDVMGRLVREFSERRQGNGVYDDERWDGRDGNGELVSPGFYLCTICAKTDIGTFRKTRPVVVVY